MPWKQPRATRIRSMLLDTRAMKSRTTLNSIETLLDAGMNFLIEYMEALSGNNPTLKDIDTFDDYEGLEEADLQQPDTFLRINDQNKEIGNLYRTATKTGHVKWEKEQKAFAEIVTANGGKYDWRLGRVSIVLGCRIKAFEFFNALAKARHVCDLDIKFGWECSVSVIRGFEKALKVSSVSILQLDLQQFRPGVVSTRLSTSTQYNMLVPIIEHANMKTIHIVLSMESLELCNIHPKRSHLRSLSVEVTARSMDPSASQILVTLVKANAALTTLNLNASRIGMEGTLELSEALKTNTTLTVLYLRFNLIGNEEAFALSETLKINTTLTTLDLRFNSIGEEGALALSEVLKTKTNLTILQ
ncbi:hypothetical protein BGZ46_001105 [Entomortierella lignicola]|nr:hypothetical protein BGZ46_001105 [Entomortierella lignicola]